MWLATSDSSSLLNFVVLILEVLILYTSGVCFIPSSIIFFFPISKVIALKATSSPLLNNCFAPNFTPRFASFPSPVRNKLPPLSARFCHCLLGPIRLVRTTVTFLGKFRLLVLSYLDKKVCSFRKVIRLGTAFFLILFFLSLFNFFVYLFQKLF